MAESFFSPCKKTITRPTGILKMKSNNPGCKQQTPKKLSFGPEASGKRTVEILLSVFRLFATKSTCRNLFTNIKLSTVEAFLRCGNFCMTDGEVFKSIGFCLPHSVRLSKIDIRSAMEQILIEGSVARFGVYQVKLPNGSNMGAIKLWNFNPECLVDCLRIALSQLQRTDPQLGQNCKRLLRPLSNSQDLLDSILMEDLRAFAICRQIEFVGKVTSLTNFIKSANIKLSESDLIRIIKPFPPEKWTTNLIDDIHFSLQTNLWFEREESPVRSETISKQHQLESQELDIGSIINEFVIAV